MNCYENLIRDINMALGKKSASQIEASDVILVDDSDADEKLEESIRRDFLYLLTLSHQKLIKEYDTEVKNRLDKDQWLSDKAINLYLERILQPLSDSTNQNVAFVKTEFYETLKRWPTSPTDDSAIKFLSAYEIVNVSKFVMVCNAPNHWYTIVVEYNWDRSAPILTFLDSLSTVEPCGEEVSSIIQKMMQVFSFLFDVELTLWEKRIPLKTRLQQDGVNCGVWALLFAESCLKGFKVIENLKDVNIHAERQRIAQEVEKLLEWNVYLSSYHYEGDIYKNRNPEAEAFLPIKAKLLKSGIYTLYTLLHIFK